ncbi:hypothetical protein Q7P37_008170 [Cladosporium fusiforme]
MSSDYRYSDADDDDETLHDIQARLLDQHNRAAAIDRASQQSLPAHPNQATKPLVRQPLLNMAPVEYPDEKFPGRYRDDEYDDDDEDDSDYEEDSYGCCTLDDERSLVSKTRAFARSRQGVMALAVFSAVVLIFLSFVNWMLYPEIVDERMRGGFMNPVMDGEVKLNTIGIAKGGEWQHGAAKIQDLDERLLPGGKHDPHGQRRLVFVGDIHGCRDELFALLDKVEFNPETDHLIATGDTINKGPHSAGVLDHLIHLNATSVRGNHEDRIIHTAKTVYDAFAQSPSSSLPALQDTDSLADITNIAHRDARTLKKLHARHLRYIQGMPLILRIRALPQASKPNSSPTSPIAEPILVVHAGLVPALPLENQDPYFVTNMRSLHAKSHVPSADRAGKRGKKVGRHNKPWRNVWNWYNERLFLHKSTKGFRKFAQSPAQGAAGVALRGSANTEKPGPWTGMLDTAKSHFNAYTGKAGKGDKPKVVVYGHDAKGGLRIKRWTKGMDSACVGGGKLSALVLNAKGEGEVFDVECPGYW